jgi:hypothetical protein
MQSYYVFSALKNARSYQRVKHYTTSLPGTLEHPCGVEKLCNQRALGQKITTKPVVERQRFVIASQPTMGVVRRWTKNENQK